jgi:PAS domain S-box-containing protein
LATTDRAIHDPESDFASVLTSVLDASTEYSIVATELDGTFILWNEGARRIYGYEPSEVLGKNLRVLYSSEDIASGKVDEILNLALARGQWEGISQRIRKGGQSFPTRIVLTVRRDRSGTPIGFLSISKDITEELRLQQRLQESEAYNRALIESANDGILITDLDGRITDVNKQMEILCGTSRENLVGRRFHEVVVPRKAAIDALHRVLTDGRVEEMEFKIGPAGGRLFDVSVNATILRGRLDQPTRIVATVRDIAESKRLREQLEMRARELEIQNERVLEANRMKSEFLARMSHELRTPLNSIIGFSDFLLTSDELALTNDQHEYLVDILNSGNHLLSLINDVLDLAKIESGKVQLTPTPFVLATAIDEVCSSLRPQVQAHSLDLRVEISPEVDQIVLDVVRFKQILYNLLSNAVKFTPTGGRIDVTAEPSEGGRFLVRVRDTGIGIPTQDIPRIFREFEQVDSGTARKYPGTGLGLSVTQKLVDLMGGTIAVQSEFGKGSTFTVRLPWMSPSMLVRAAPAERSR